MLKRPIYGIGLALALLGAGGVRPQTAGPQKPATSEEQKLLPRMLPALPVGQPPPDPATIQAAERRLRIRQLLAGPERQDIPWKVTFPAPRLVFDQRHEVIVRARIDPELMQKTSMHRDLEMILTAQDSSGHWMNEGSVTHLELDKPVDRHSDLEFESRVLARSGRHLFGLILYDRVTGQHNVMRRWVDVPPIKNDPLPELERVPEIDFLRLTPGRSANPQETARRADGRERSPLGGNRGTRLPGMPRGARGEISDEPPTPLAPELAVDDADLASEYADLRLPIRNPQPLSIDVLVDYTPSWQFAGAPAAYRVTGSIFRQVTHVLSLLRPENGCVRITGVDVLGQKVLFQDMPGERMDWNAATEAIYALDPNKVDVESLANRKRMTDFFRNQVSRMLEKRETECPDGAKPAQHVFIVAASGIVFPEGSRRIPVDEVTGEAVHMYYLRAILRRDALWDEMEKIVKPLHPRLLRIDSPMEFRKAMGTIVTELRAGTPNTEEQKK